MKWLKQKMKHFFSISNIITIKMLKKVVHRPSDRTPGGQSRPFAPINPIPKYQHPAVFMPIYGKNVGDRTSGVYVRKRMAFVKGGGKTVSSRRWPIPMIGGIRGVTEIPFWNKKSSSIKRPNVKCFSFKNSLELYTWIVMNFRPWTITDLRL